MWWYSLDHLLTRHCAASRGDNDRRRSRARSRVALACLALAAFVVPLESVVAAERPNILLIFADDQRWDTIAALGNPEIRTPHLDRLVARGFHFTNAYCMGSMIPAVCTPSRTMLLTGRSLWRIPDPRAAEIPPGIVPLPTALRSAGYTTWHCGKRGNSYRAAHAAFDTNLESDGRSAASATEHSDHAIEFLKQHDGARPFFMYLAPPVPHDPRLAPDEFTRLYDPEGLSLSKNFLPEHPFDNGELRVRDELLAPHPRTPADMRRHLADYYATISHLDHEVGRVLATLEARGWTDNTIVIFSSDQGLAVGGRHGLMGKQNLYEHFKSPLVIAGPDIPHGQSAALVYLFDLFPTICDLVGATIPADVEGRSLLPIIRGEEAKLREYLLCGYRQCQRMLRDDRWKLIEYQAADGSHTQLFDLQQDPDELNNLAADPQFAPERARLKRVMRKIRHDYGDSVALVSPAPTN
ncbi:MAG: sulfatase-like hydrolase/transferase [Pirellulales bacterium]|nr:sulfatase-like hydrolase/transferase [Pirellulales bacterium]